MKTQILLALGLYFCLTCLNLYLLIYHQDWTHLALIAQIQETVYLIIKLDQVITNGHGLWGQAL